MADVDFNSVLEDIFLIEEKEHDKSYQEGFKTGCDAGNPEGYHLGYHRGAEIGKELGYYLGIIAKHIANDKETVPKNTDKLKSQLVKVKDLIEGFPHENSPEHDILEMLENIRAQYKKACTFLKISPNNPYQTSISF